MGIYNEIYTGRIPRAIQKLFGMKGQPPVRSLSGDLSVSVPLFYGAENRALEGWSRLGGRVNATAVALNTSGGRLFNPAGSNIIAVLEKITFGTSTGGATVLLNIERPALTSNFPLAGSQLNFDARNISFANLVAGTCQVQGKNNNSTFFGVVVGSFTPNGTSAFDIIGTDIQEIPLLPGDAFNVTVVTVNIGIDITFWWRERFLEDTERTV